MKSTRQTQQSAPIVADRVRSIGQGGFAYVPNRFLRDGFFAALGDDERVLYLLLVLGGNRQGMRGAFPKRGHVSALPFDQLQAASGRSFSVARGRVSHHDAAVRNDQSIKSSKRAAFR